MKAENDLIILFFKILPSFNENVLFPFLYQNHIVKFDLYLLISVYMKITLGTHNPPIRE